MAAAPQQGHAAGQARAQDIDPNEFAPLVAAPAGQAGIAGLESHDPRVRQIALTQREPMSQYGNSGRSPRRLLGARAMGNRLDADAIAPKGVMQAR